MQLLRWNNRITQGHDTRRASSMVRGAGWREPNPRLRRREKNVLDIPLYRPGVYTQNPRRECNQDFATVKFWPGLRAGSWRSPHDVTNFTDGNHWPDFRPLFTQI